MYRLGNPFSMGYFRLRNVGSVFRGPTTSTLKCQGQQYRFHNLRLTGNVLFGKIICDVTYSLCTTKRVLHC